MKAGIVLSGGTGNRFGGNIPKQYATLCGKEVLAYTMDALRQSSVDEIVVAASDAYAEHVRETYGVSVVIGGNTRNESLKRALDYVHAHFSCDKVIILEAARPMITPERIDSYLQGLDEYDAVITGQKIVASLGCYHMHTVDREDYYLIEAPEAFRFPLLYENFRADSKITATNQQLPEGSAVGIRFDFANNVKITYPNDLAYCRSLLRS